MKASRTKWWLEGTETCRFCVQTYVYEEEYRCVGCDAGICAECAVFVRQTEEVYCPECAEDMPQRA